MNFDIFYVDTFTEHPFKGNPAAVCITKQPLDEAVMQNIAMEINLSETAFVHCISKDDNYFGIRWFTPTTEVDLCGHATLATAHVLYDKKYALDKKLKFLTITNEVLYTFKSKHGITLDFPVDKLRNIDEATKSSLLVALKLNSLSSVYKGQYTKQIIIDVNDENIVLGLDPNFSDLLKLYGTYTGVAITAKSKNYDFVSRFFDPWEGINEDPVTGSAHTLLAPYWSQKLKKEKLIAKQVSTRGGELVLQLEGNRVYISGSAVTVFCGTMKL